jgi:dCTP deaminase
MSILTRQAILEAMRVCTGRKGPDPSNVVVTMPAQDRWDPEIKIDPFDPRRLNENSYDVTLAPTLLVYEQRLNDIGLLARKHELDNGIHPWMMAPLDCKQENAFVTVEIPADGVVLEPGRLYLGVTREYTETHRHVPFLEGKSSLGRLGMSIHVTAGKGDVGFCGHWTMEITVVHPLRIYAGMPCGQLIFHTVEGPMPDGYAKRSGSKYAHGRQANPVPMPSQMWRNFDGNGNR